MIEYFVEKRSGLLTQKKAASPSPPDINTSENNT